MPKYKLRCKIDYEVNIPDRVIGFKTIHSNELVDLTTVPGFTIYHKAGEVATAYNKKELARYLRDPRWELVS